MGLATNQQYDEKKKEKESWSFRTLFQKFSSISKIFHTPFSFCLLVTIFFAGFCEISGRQPSWSFYLMALVLMFLSLSENQPKK